MIVVVPTTTATCPVHCTLFSYDCSFVLDLSHHCYCLASGRKINEYHLSLRLWYDSTRDFQPVLSNEKQMLKKIYMLTFTLKMCKSCRHNQWSSTFLIYRLSTKSFSCKYTSPRSYIKVQTNKSNLKNSNFKCQI